MDLAQLEAWTRQKLETEAVRRGIRAPEAHTRLALITKILRHDYASVRTLRDARKLALSLAARAADRVPGPLASLLRARAQLTNEVAHQSPTATRVVATPVVTPTAPAKPTASTRSFIEEPIRTRSMARLLAAQGHRERALAIYEELIARGGQDAELAAEAEALRAQAHGDLAPEPIPLPKPAHALRLPDSGDRIACDGASGRLEVSWQVSAEGQARAAALLGAPGELTLRVVTIRHDPQRVVRSDITEHGPVEPGGRWSTTPPEAGARSFATIGLRAGERFVSIVHCEA